MDYVFESIRIENFFVEDLMLHIERLCNSAFLKFNIIYHKDVLLKKTFDYLKKEIRNNKGILKFNIFLFENSTVDFKLAPYLIDKSDKLTVINKNIRKTNKTYFKDRQYHLLFNNYYDIYKNFQDLILLNENNNISECMTSNIFFSKGKELITPDISEGLFAGITRNKILKIACLKGINLKETTVPVEYIGDFDSCFVINSLKRIIFISIIEYNGLIFNYNKDYPFYTIYENLSKYIDRVPVF